MDSVYVAQNRLQWGGGCENRNVTLGVTKKRKNISDWLNEYCLLKKKCSLIC
jgi:hypothetical protein